MNRRISSLIGLCLMTAAVVFGAHPYQVTQVNGKVTLKQADGNVTVDGQPAKLNSAISSGSTVTTAKGSSAVVSLGKLGRVELMPDSTVKLEYGNTGGATAMLSQGRVRVSSSSGVSATVKTGDAEIISNPSRASRFMVDLSCGDTLVSVQSGRVELRAGNSVKQIAAGGQDTAGTSQPGCKR
jgi:ferric-dicitrate binding protein FerR (iron transport regulator)